jgi:hypothetical protein
LRLNSAFDRQRAIWHTRVMGRQRFEILSEIADVQPIATGRYIRDLARLRKRYGPGRWRKMKGVATIRLRNGRVRRAELHWYEAHGIGRMEIKRKRYLGED